ncbi:MAG: nucleotide exchange factor GrpE [Pirellulales bacterium]|nr:nucleotide exchange factor GrpE [Pirellulales bacterium]
MSKMDPTQPKQTDRNETGATEAKDADRRAAETQGGEKSSSAPEPAGTAESNEYETLRSDLEQMKDRALRVQAELENYRKRVAREMADERRYAELSLMRDLLPVLDNMERALEAAEKSGEAPQLREGFKIVVDQFQGILQRHHCVPIKALHEPFDPNFHEAILQQPSADHPPGTVLHVAQSGYRLHDRVVRPSQVIVSAAPVARKNGPKENNP